MSLEAEALTVRLGRATVIDRASLSLEPGKVTALIGPNGAGKSTLLRAMAGLLPARGDIRLVGRPATREGLREAVAYMPQETSARSSLTLLEVVLLGRLRSLGLNVSRQLVTEAAGSLSRLGLAPLAGRTLDAVSGGQRQLAFLAQALFRAPDVLLLDEPTAALDLRHQLLVLEIVRQTARRDGIAVAVAMHDLTLAAHFADAFLCLANGRIDAMGDARSVLVPDRLSRLYGVETEIIPSSQDLPVILPIRAL
ncbi:MAG: ABC transporter ATP-binding protein [Pseudomonadota bacterium]